MDQLWAPWRLHYVANASPGSNHAGCFLCRIQEETHDAENYLVERGQNTILVLNRFPYNNGHLLIAPKLHLAEPGDLDDETTLECQRAICRWIEVIRRRMNADGFNVGLNLGRVAGAGVPGHLHWHIVPRWNGDTNFMPVLGDVRVIPQSLAALYELLRSEIAPSKRGT